MSLTFVHNRQASGGYHPTSLMKRLEESKEEGKTKAAPGQSGGGAAQAGLGTRMKPCRSAAALGVRLPDVYQHQPIPERLGCNPVVDLCDFLPFTLHHMFTLYFISSGLSD